MVQSLRGRGKASHAAPLPKERAAGARAVEIPGSRAGTFRRIGFRVLFAFVLTRLVIVPESSRFMRAHFKKGPVHTCTHARAHTRTSRRCFLKGLSDVVCFVPCGHLAFCELHLESVPACPSNVTGTGKVIISIRTSEFGLLLVNLTVPYIY